jgi:hypothetical protein
MAGEAVNRVDPLRVLWLRFCFVRVWRQLLLLFLTQESQPTSL